MVSYEMEVRLANNDLGEGLEDIIYNTKEDLLQSVMNSYASSDSSISIDEFRTGLETVKDNSKRTLEIFYDFFKKNISLALQDQSLAEGPKADLCFRLLPYLNEENQSMMKQVYESCSKVKKSSYKDGPKIEFKHFVEKSIGSGPFKRAKYSFRSNIDEKVKFCSYSNYHDASILFDQQMNKKAQNLMRKK
jgi:hypothetical protein